MINVTDATKSAYTGDSIHKDLTITFPNRNITFTNSDIVSESQTLVESIESENNLTFKGCIASQYKFKVAEIVTDLRGEYVEASIQAGETEVIPVFKGYVESQSNLTKEDIVSEFTCYDALYSIGEKNMKSWFDGLIFPMTVKQFRTALLTNLGITQETVTLINDNQSIGAEIKNDVDNPSARELLRMVCEVNARFGQMGRNGVFKYKELAPITRGTYPSTETFPSLETFPSAENAGVIISPTEMVNGNLNYEPYENEKITKVLIIKKDGTIGGQAGSGTNAFVIKDNPIAYNINMNQAASAFLAKVSSLNFDPVISLETVGMPWLECGDSMMAYTRRNTVRAFILNRTFKGIQALRDEIVSDADQYQPEYKPTEQTKISKNETEIANTNANVSTVNGRVTTVDSRVTGVDNRVTGVSNQVTTISGQVVNLNGNVNNLNGQVTNLNSSVTNINSSVTNINSEVTNIKGTLNVLSITVGTLSATAVTTNNLSAKISQLGAVSVSGNLTCGGTLGSNGGLRISGGATISGNLAVGGNITKGGSSVATQQWVIDNFRRK